jgi:hypothetical protein
MRAFLQNNFRFPARRASLNRAHPLLAGSHLGIAAVANVPGGMTDLNTGVISTNTNTLSPVNELGQCARGGNAVNSSTFLTWAGPTNPIAQITASCIIKYTGTGTMWPLALANQATTGIEVTTTTAVINWQQAATNIFGNYVMKLGHCYFYLVSNRSDTMGGSGYSVIVDMTTGLVWTASNSTSGLGQLPLLTLMNVLQQNDANTGGPNPIAAVHVSANFTTASLNATQQRMDLGTLLEAATKPWSLWYA